MWAPSVTMSGVLDAIQGTGPCCRWVDSAQQPGLLTLFAGYGLSVVRACSEAQTLGLGDLAVGLWHLLWCDLLTFPAPPLAHQASGAYGLCGTAKVPSVQALPALVLLKPQSCLSLRSLLSNLIRAPDSIAACPLLSPYAALSFFTALHSLDMLCIDLSLNPCLSWSIMFHQSWNFVLFVIPSLLPG